MRTLSWKHTLGLVTMDVELADRTLSVAVTPVQAVVLLYFQDQGELISPLLFCPLARARHYSLTSCAVRHCPPVWAGLGQPWTMQAVAPSLFQGAR
jgi:hypothetical protein